MIKLEISGSTSGEVVENLRGLLATFENAPQTTAATPGVSSTGKPASGRTRAKANEEKPNISTGEERVDPKDSPADEKQDAKDEAADTAAQQPKPMVLTHDSVRSLLGGYVQAFGMAAAQEDGPKLIGIAKISEIPDDQKALAKAVIAIATGIEKNPHKRTLEGDGIEAEKMAEMKPIVQHAQKVLA